MPTDDRTDDCAFGAMMSLALGRSSENYVFTRTPTLSGAGNQKVQGVQNPFRLYGFVGIPRKFYVRWSGEYRVFGVVGSTQNQ
jgi:hypothetical protein